MARRGDQVRIVQQSDARPVASVLIIAADPNIEALVGELVAFAGHRPICDPTLGAGGESLRRTRPAIAMLDTALSRDVVRSCLSAADEVGSRAVLLSSTANAAEMARQAAELRCGFFVLPGGPRELSATLAGVLKCGASRTTDAGHGWDHASPGQAESVHPAVCAALAGIMRVRAVLKRGRETQDDNRFPRGIGRDLLAETRRSQAALRAAVCDCARQLRAAHVPEADALLVVRDMISGCAATVSGEPAIDSLLSDSAGWAREVYAAA